ncbi:hypothetical protein NE237_001718 [Protea cynaroides]|uniref:Uncharacterized protein n=1 Tax=Protea cynaroides TaxID=273540 RepID=A0A9Q0KTM2_9MAGN|nr:hypothetical protein NE237_001718 [Protea cynaroides]
MQDQDARYGGRRDLATCKSSEPMQVSSPLSPLSMACQELLAPQSVGGGGREDRLDCSLQMSLICHMEWLISITSQSPGWYIHAFLVAERLCLPKAQDQMINSNSRSLQRFEVW